MCFIQLTTPGSGKKIHVNLDTAHNMEPDMRSGKYTIISYGPSENYIVRESIDEILTLGAAVLCGQRVMVGA